MVSWYKERGYKAQITPKSEPCGFKWAKTHNKCVHDSMQLANVTTNPCLMWPHYISYVIKLRTQLSGPYTYCSLDKGVAYTGRGAHVAGHGLVTRSLSGEGWV